MRRLQLALPFLRVMSLGALLSGCKAEPGPTGAPHLVVADVIVTVTNQAPRGLEVSVGSETVKHALGPVPGRSSRSFSLPSDLGQSGTSLHFEARARGKGAGIRSEAFSVAPGQQVVWVVGELGGGSVTKQ